MNKEKFIVKLNHHNRLQFPDYFVNFVNYCHGVAEKNSWNISTVINYELKPYGRWIPTKTQGSYLRWDDPKYHTAFVLKWS
jgi:hypothetical protein